MSDCKHCGKMLESVRSTKQYCDTSCRVAYRRSVDASKQVLDALSKMPIGHLEAIYNDAWRKAHNDIQKDHNDEIRRLIAVTCAVRVIKITGSGGKFEFKYVN